MPLQYFLPWCFLFPLCGLSAQVDSLIDAQDTTIIGSEQRAILYSLLQTFPEGGEAAVALIDGETTTFYGVRRENGQLITVANADRGFGVGSVTKVLTATLLTDFVANGEVALDDPVNAVFDFPFPDSISFTYRQLATHTSGLPRMPNNMPGLLLTPDNPFSNYTGRQNWKAT